MANEADTRSMLDLIRLLLALPEEVNDNVVKPIGNSIQEVLREKFRREDAKKNPDSSQRPDAGKSGLDASSSGTGPDSVPDGPSASKSPSDSLVLEVDQGNGSKVYPLKIQGGQLSFGEMSLEDRECLSQVLGLPNGQLIRSHVKLPPITLKYYPQPGAQPVILFHAKPGEAVINRLGEIPVSSELLQQVQGLVESSGKSEQFSNIDGIGLKEFYPGEPTWEKVKRIANPWNLCKASINFFGSLLRGAAGAVSEGFQEIVGDKARSRSAILGNNVMALFEAFATSHGDVIGLSFEGVPPLPPGRWHAMRLSLADGYQLVAFISPKDHPGRMQVSLRDANGEEFWRAECGDERRLQVLSSNKLSPQQQAMVDSLLEPKLANALRRHYIPDIPPKHRNFNHWHRNGEVCHCALQSLSRSINHFPGLAHFLPQPVANSFLNIYATHIARMVEALQVLTPTSSVSQFMKIDGHMVGVETSKQGYILRTIPTTIPTNRQALRVMPFTSTPNVLEPPEGNKNGTPPLIAVMKLAGALFQQVTNALAFVPEQNRPSNVVHSVSQFQSLVSGESLGLLKTQFPSSPKIEFPDLGSILTQTQKGVTFGPSNQFDIGGQSVGNSLSAQESVGNSPSAQGELMSNTTITRRKRRDIGKGEKGLNV
jgi:hypothetical protein